MSAYVRMSFVVIAATLALLFVFSEQALGQSVSWTQLTPTGGPPSARVTPTAVLDNFDNMIVFGGFEGTVGVPPMFNDVWILSAADGSGPASTWKQLMPAGTVPAGRGYHSAVYAPATNSMIIFGGDLSVGFCFASTNDVWVLANANGTGGTPTWTQLSPAGVRPSARDNGSAVYGSESNRMIIFGGQIECSSQSDEIWVLANANGIGGTPTWIQLSPAAGPSPGARAGHAAVYDAGNNRMIVFGGGTSSGLVNDVWVLVNANGLGGTPTWTQLAPTGPLPAVTASAAAIYDPIANTMTIFGGSTNAGFTDKVWLLTNANGLGGTPAWTQLQTTAGSPGARYSDSAVFNPSTGRMIMFGGADASGAAHNDTWVLAPSQVAQNDAWTTKAPMPTARSSGALAAINGKVYTTNGGGSTSPDVNTLEIFDPATGGWSSGASSPNSRTYVGSAVIGSTLYMIGGCIHADCRIGTTGLVETYDSTMDSWSTVTSMPTPRSISAVGVINGMIYVATGLPACPPCVPRSTALEVFDPATNSWSSKAPAPTPRAGATGSVVNGKLYVIGGLTDSGNVVSGLVEVYDPATDSWSTGAPVPTPRYSAASVAMNGLIHVIGGQDTLATIAAAHEVYDPASNTWSTKAPMPVPAVDVMATVIGSQLYAGGGRLFFPDGSCCNVLNSFEVYTAAAAPDLIPPTTTAAASPGPNAAGWNNSDVTVTLAATDNSGGSGVKQIVFSSAGAQVISSTTVNAASASVTINTEGTTTLSFFAVDAAGNIEASHSLAIKLDKTPPVIVGSSTPLANANGWNNTGVTVSFTCTDALSGVAANGGPVATILTSEGVNQQVTGACQDIAGNVASFTVSGINIDKTPPVIAGMPSGCSLWPPNHKLVQVARVSATDTLSGLATFSVSVSSNEPDGEQPEFVVSGSTLQPQAVQLRAERSGGGMGRVYRIAAAASDLAGNVANSSAICAVPHDQSGK